ncbi:hypothetical protein ACFO6W_16900, partial [Dysgonomonas termitidis]
RRSAFEEANPGKKYEKDYPAWLEAMIMKCLEKKPENRYRNAQVFFDEIERNLAGSKGWADNELAGKLQAENTRLTQKMNNLYLYNTDLETQVEKLKKNADAKDFSIQQLGLHNFDATEKLKQLESKNQELQKQLAAEQMRQIPETEIKHNPFFIALTIVFAVVALGLSAYLLSHESGDQATIEQQATELSDLKQKNEIIRDSVQIIPSNSGSDAEIKKLREEISRLKNQGGNSSQVSGLNQEINNLKSQLRTKDNEIKALKKTIGDI